MQLSVDTPENLYPDLIEKGGLGPAVKSALAEIRSPLELKESEFPIKGFPVCARVERINRFSQIYIGSEQRMFSCDFWQDGISLGRGRTESLIELARVLHEWMAEDVKVTELSKKFEFVTFSEIAPYFEQGREVEWKWQDCLDYIPRSFPELVPFVEAAIRNPRLRRLFPFTSLSRFCLSRCTGYPYSDDCPSVVYVNDRYAVLNPAGKFIGEGSADEAVKLVESHLPLNADAAVKGTVDDLPAPIYRS